MFNIINSRNITLILILKIFYINYIIKDILYNIYSFYCVLQNNDQITVKDVY